MKFIMEITKDCVIRKFVDMAIVIEEKWIKKGTGRYGTTGKAIEDMMKQYGYDKKLIKAIEDGDFIDIFREIEKIETERRMALEGLYMKKDE